MFTEEERIKQIILATGKMVDLSDLKKLNVVSFQGLLVDYAKQIDAKVLIRGIRSVSDFEYEINLSNVNKILAANIETVFLPTSPELAVISSSMVKEIARLGGDISKFVPKHIATQLNEKFGFIKFGNP